MRQIDREDFTDAYRGDTSRLEEIINKGNIDQLSGGRSLLWCAVNSSLKTKGSYTFAIALLEAGANPLQPCPGRKNETPFFVVLEMHSLALARLLLWFSPKLEEIKTPKRDNGEIWTAINYIKISEALEHDKGLYRDYAKWIFKTAEDAKHMRSLINNAQKYIAEKKYNQAALCYQKAAEIYAEHEVLEDKLIYRPDGFCSDPKRAGQPEEYRPILKAYYQSKKQYCFEQRDQCLAYLEKNKPTISTEEKKGEKEENETAPLLLSRSDSPTHPGLFQRRAAVPDLNFTAKPATTLKA